MFSIMTRMIGDKGDKISRKKITGDALAETVIFRNLLPSETSKPIIMAIMENMILPDYGFCLTPLSAQISASKFQNLSQIPLKIRGI